MDKELVTVEIPADLFKKIEKKLGATENKEKSISDYIVEVLNNSLSKDQPETDKLSEEDEEKVKERLKALGYMD